MKWLVLVNPGIEELAATELTSFGIKNLKINPACLIIEATVNEIIKIAYRCQSINRILSFLDEFSFTTLDELKKKIKKIKIEDIQSLSFAARSEQINSNISSSEIQPLVGEIINKKTKAKVDLSHPDMIIFTFINKKKVIVCLLFLFF